VLDVKGLRVSQNAYAANLTVVNINTGGTIRLNAFGLDVSSVKNGTVNFNGGTVVARDSSVSFDFLGTTSTNWRNIAVNVLPGGAIVDNNTYSFTMRQNMAGSAGDGGFTKLNSGYLYMRGTNTFTGGFRIKGGAVNIIRDHNLGAAPSSPSTNVWFLADATLQSSDTHALDANRTLFISTNVTVTLDTQSYTQTVNGIITGLGKSWLTKSGTGLLAINPGANRTNSVSTFRVAAGTVQILSGTTEVTTNDFSTTNIGLDINGGNMIISGGKIRTTGIGYCAVNGSLLVTNGTVDCSSSRELLNAFNGHGTTTVASNGVLNARQFRISQCGDTPISSNAININTGGIIRADNFYIDTTYYRPWGYLNLNGGTLVANVNRTDFLGTGVAQWQTNIFVRVLEGGAIIDTEDKSISIQQSLYRAAVSDGGLTKRGNGTLTLLNTNTYNGATSVEGGTLKLGVLTNTLLTSGSAFVSSNAVFDINTKVQTLAGLGGSGTVTNNSLLTVTGAVMPGGTNVIGTLTLASACSLSGELRVDVATNGVCDRLYIQGDLSVTNLALKVADTGLLNENRRYVIASCSGAVSGPFASAALPRRWFVQYDAANRRVYLIYNRGTALTLR
jgi:autotransporter-associated beta strand protein